MFPTRGPTRIGPFRSRAATRMSSFRRASTCFHRCVNDQSFSLHPEVRLAINQRHTLEHLCLNIARRTIANERLTCRTRGAHPEDTLSRWHDAHHHVATGVHATPGRARPPFKAPSHGVLAHQCQAMCRDHPERAGQSECLFS